MNFSSSQFSFSEKDITEEEKNIKQTILLIFKEELIKLGLINENTNQKNQGKENAEKNVQDKGNKGNNINKNKRYNNKKKTTQNERLDEIIKKIENDGGPKYHLINQINKMNNNLFSYFFFDSDKLNELTDNSKEKLLTML